MFRWLGNRLGLLGIRARLDSLIHKVDFIMAKEADLQKDLDAIAAGVTAANAAIADLKQQIIDLGNQTAPVSQDQLDALTAQADAIVAALTPGT
jgi:cell division protein FtsB